MVGEETEEEKGEEEATEVARTKGSTQERGVATIFLYACWPPHSWYIAILHFCCCAHLPTSHTPTRLHKEKRRQNVPGDSKCLYSALSGVEGKNSQSAADEIRRALTEGDMA